TPAASVACGVALGIPDDGKPDTLTRRVYAALEQGYRRVKIKVMPGWDAVAVSAARAAMGAVELPLTVDANGAYAWPVHEESWRALDDAGLLYIEQPLAPDELVAYAALSRTLHTPVCLDETLTSATIARQVMELEGPRVWNIKVHRVGGLAEVCRIYQLAARYGADLWVGTMPESGIGSQASLAVAQQYHASLFAGLHWRLIGPFRGGRTVGATGVPGQPNVLYIGVNNGGVWKSTDYGRTWRPIFDAESTGSVGALAVASSDP